MSAPTASQVLARVGPALERFSKVVLCQIVRTEGSTPGTEGWKLLVDPEGEAFGNLGGGAFEALVTADAREILARRGDRSALKRYYLTEDAVKGQATGMVCGGMIEVFLEVLRAPTVLVVCGGGPVGQAVAHQGALCGFDVVVAEDRPAFRRSELFPEGTRRVEVDRDYSAPFLEPWHHRRLAVAIVSRCWETDLAACRSVLDQRPPGPDCLGLDYLGLMGSRRKVARISSELESAGYDLGTVAWHAPIGLPIGGETPAEIALSIVAEIVGERHRSTAGEDGRDEPVRMV